MTDHEFRFLVRDWLAQHLTGEFAGLRGAGGPGSEHEVFEQWLAWDRLLRSGIIARGAFGLAPEPVRRQA